MQNNLPTEAGRSKQPSTKTPSQNLPSEDKLALVDAINQVFTLYRLNYHNQYLKAFSNTEEINQVKRLWLEVLAQFSPSCVLSAARRVIESSEYLPTLKTMIQHCERASSDQGVADAHSAYLEACRAPSPKAHFKWSHPAIYHAGKSCDWYFLQSTPESVAYPIFRLKYEEICHQLRLGLSLEIPANPAPSKKPAAVADKATNLKKLAALRASLDL